jgi:hypothetical protein
VILNDDFEQTKIKLQENWIIVNDTDTLEDISKNNNIELQKIVEMIFLKR